MEADDLELTYTLETFQVEDVTRVIRRLESSPNETELEAELEKLTVLLDQYQEQCHLMDPFLEDIMDMLFQIIRNPSTTSIVFHQVFKYVYLFTKVRGYKQTIRYFSHDVSDLEYVLKLLKDQSPLDHRTWETRYVLLLWLGIICIIPFNLCLLDGSSIREEDMVVNRILDIILNYYDVSDKCKDAAAYLAAKFLTRPDVKNLKLGKFIDYATAILSSPDKVSMNGRNAIMGLISILVQIFKHGFREDLLPYSSKVLKCILDFDAIAIDHTLIRKLAAKLVQRLGLVFLVPKVAGWRYTRGNRSLAQNLFRNTLDEERKGEEELGNEEDVYDIPEDVEDVLQFFFVSLKDKDTVVRWTTAKGVGRITARLPKELADEVVGCILELFQYSEMDGAWHGGCLALAELGRRGLLLPQRLDDVVPIILNALKYDERRGSYSVGSHVRDAACYVCWSFARAYEPSQMKKHVVDIATSLLITTVFDREVNCRRAASAAFQENVGRQGTFPHGIDILTTADYYAVGNRYNCYCTLSVFIASFPEYRAPLIDHLRFVTVSHWDITIRQLTAQALHNLTSVAKEYMQNIVLPYLLEQTTSIDICTKHGSIICVGEIIYALYNLTESKEKCFSLPADVYALISQLVGKLRNGNKLKGCSGEVIRIAVCKLIRNLSLSHITVFDTLVLDDWFFVIEDTIPYVLETAHKSAILALQPFILHYVLDSQHFVVRDIVYRYCTKVKSQNKFERMGFATAMGELPCSLVQSYSEDVFDALICCCVVEEDRRNAGIFAEARRNAVHAITKLCSSMLAQFDVLSKHINNIYSCLLKATEDYTIDSRGDVGAWVREAALSSLCTLTFLLVENHSSYITEDCCHQIMNFLMQQASEKIDRTRAVAGNLLLQMIHYAPEIPFIPKREQLKHILPRSLIDTLNWACPKDGFQTMMKLLHLKEYQYSILLGMCVSAGGLTESLVRASSDCLLEFISHHQEDDVEMNCLINNLLLILRNYKRDDRVILPMLKMMDTLLSTGSLDSFNTVEKSGDFPLQVVMVMKDIVRGSGDMKKLLASINVFCGFISFQGNVSKKALSQLMVFLCHKYPRIRKATAEQLYTTLVTYDNIVMQEEHLNVVLGSLIEVSWDENVETIRPVRNDICKWLGVETPKIKKAVTAANGNSGGAVSSVTQLAPTVQNLDVLDNYKDLVSREF